MTTSPGTIRRPTQLLDEEEELRATIHKWAEERLRPRVAQMDREASIPQDLIDELFNLGLMGIQIPADHGGGGARCS